MRKFLIRGLLLLLAGAVLLAAAFTAAVLWPPAPLPPAQRTEQPVAITGVSVIDVVAGEVRHDVTLLIEGGMISSIGSVADATTPTDAVIVDGRGKFLIPALWDMHAHVGSGMADRLSLPLFLANGVTAIRDMGGDADRQQKADWDRQARAGKLAGPRFVSRAGVSVMRMGSPADAGSIVEGLDLETEFVKIYNAVLPDDFQALMAAARKTGVAVAGHRPRAVSALDASDAGMRSLEHARLFLFEGYPGAADLRERYRASYAGESDLSGRLDDPAALREMVDQHDPEMFEELVEAMVRNGTWFCPTHITRKMDALADDAAYRSDSRLRYITRVQRMGWRIDADGMIARDPSPEGRRAYRDFHEKGLELTGAAHQAGVRILAGSDANDTYCFPGFGLHDELQELVRAGLSPLDALRAATLNAAEYLDLTATHGSVDVGKVADLVLLDADPLVDITATTRIRAVVFGGHLYDRANLDDLLAYVEARAASLSAAAKLLWAEGL